MNTTLHYNKELSAALSDMSGIFNAVVMVTNHNAYAAIMLDNTGTGTKGVGTTRETNNTGNTRGMYDPKTGNQSPDPNEVATGNNSYYTETSPDNLSHLLKQTIAKKLRNKKPQLLEVYITANRGFVNQMSIYQVEAQKGVNLNGYLTDFNKLVIKHFGSDNY